MAGKLKTCVDCGNNYLSPTAKVCSKCDSTDPFGKERNLNKIRFVLVIGVLAFFALCYYKVVDPAVIFHKLFGL